MSKKLICDKCGKAIKGVDYNLSFKRKSFIMLDKEYNYDLCGECFDKFLGFLDDADLKEFINEVEE